MQFSFNIILPHSCLWLHHLHLIEGSQREGYVKNSILDIIIIATHVGRQKQYIFSPLGK